AEAMLNTWEVSYFQTEGLRLFFTLPQEWTDRVLPLAVKGYDRVETVRAMIGRIELISDRQRVLLKKIASGPASNRDWFMNWQNSDSPQATEKMKELASGEATLEDVGLKPPADYQAYMELGRFRDALVLHELKYPYPREQKFEHVSVRGPRIQIRHPVFEDAKVDRFTISLPGENRTINLTELEILNAEGKDIAKQLELSQSSNYQGRLPVRNLVDGNRESMVHTNFETDPWVKGRFAEAQSIREFNLWNRNDTFGRFLGRFDGGRITFSNGDKTVAEVTVECTGTKELYHFVRNYNLPLR
ncbi:MAG: hypothetical protein AAF492_32985, partial [Verrucomicrobiota bacterium]